MIKHSTELFKVILNTNGTITIKFSDYVKKRKSAKELERIIRTEIERHMSPIIKKLLHAILEPSEDD